MDVKQEYFEIYKHDIKTEAALICCEIEEYNSPSIKSEKFKTEDENELCDMVSIFESQVTEQLISVNEFKQDIIECEVPKIELLSEFPKKIDSDLVAEQVKILPTSNFDKQELENSTNFQAADISDSEIKQKVLKNDQFQYETELIIPHCDLPTLKSENKDYPDYYFTQSCSSIEDISSDISKNCSKEHPCIDCQRSYSSSQLGLEQIDEGQSKKHLCLKQFNDLQQLSNQINSNEKQFRCDICCKEFNNKSNFKQHLKVHTNEEPFQCDICFKEFKHKRSLHDHLIIHTNETSFKCTICFKEFNMKSNLRQHLMTHTNDMPFECEICSKKFKFKSYLNEHLAIHSNQKAFKCNICSKEFNLKRILRQHLIIHSNEKSFKCNICSKEFKRTQNLQYHLIIHTNERPFKCDICFKRFNLKPSLQKHLIRHSDKKLFKCDICVKEFHLKSGLKRHLIKHSNEKPFNCNICSKKFKHKRNLENHLIIHTN